MLRDKRTNAQLQVYAEQERLEAARRTVAEKRVASMRNLGDEPDTSNLPAIERAIADAQAKVEAAIQAVNLANQDMVEAMQNPPQEVLDNLRERGHKHEDRYNELMAQAQIELRDLGRIYQIHKWARGALAPGDFRLAPPGPHTGLIGASEWRPDTLDWNDAGEGQGLKVIHSLR